MSIFFWEILLAVIASVRPELLSIFSQQSHLLALFTIFVSFVLAMIGAVHAKYPKIRQLEYSFPRGTGVSTSFRIVAASDIHLGTIIGKKRFDRLVTQINSLNPDLVFFV